MEKFDRLRVGGPICSICFFYPLSGREAAPHQNGLLPTTTPCFSETCYRFWGLVDICVFFGKSATIFFLRKWPPAVVFNFPKNICFGWGRLPQESHQINMFLARATSSRARAISSQLFLVALTEVTLVRKAFQLHCQTNKSTKFKSK